MLQEWQAEQAQSAGLGTGQVFRSASWVTLLSDTQRLADLLAMGWASDRLSWITPDTRSDDRLARQFVRSASRWALTQAHAWDDYSDEITALQEGLQRLGLRPALDMALADSATLSGSPSALATIVASVDPMRYVRWSAELEHAGSRILRAALMPTTRPDVWNKNKRTHVTRPDRVAFRGTERFQRPQPCRYGASGLQPAGVRCWVVDSLGVCERSASELLLTEDLSRPVDGRVRHGWRGRTRITWTLADREPGLRTRALRAAAASERARVKATGKRGKAVTAWDASPRSLLRAAAPLAHRVDNLVEVLSALAVNESLVFSDGTRVYVLGRGLTRCNGREYSALELARRATLAGLTLS